MRTLSRIRRRPAALRIAGVLAFGTLLVGTASVAGATVLSPEVLIRPELPSRPFRDGESFAVPVTVFIRDDASADPIRARAGGDLSMSPDARRAVPLDVPPGYRAERHVLRGTFTPDVEAVTFEVEVNGGVFVETVRLRHDESDGEIIRYDDHGSVERRRDPGAQLESPDPVPSGYPTPETEGMEARSSMMTVNVRGRLITRVPGDRINRGVDGVSVYFMQVRGTLDDLELGSATTGTDGNFDFDVPFEGPHDVYVKFRAINSYVNVGTDAGFQTYERNVGTRRNFSDPVLDLGTFSIGHEGMNHAVWLVTSLTRARRWYAEHGFSLPQVNCRWPDDVLGSSCYLPIIGLDGIHLRTSATFNSDTVVHEYGHHFVAASTVDEVWPPDYANGICDPGHCGWCQENEAVAWSEGLPYFLSQVINDDHLAEYGWAPPNRRHLERHSTCTPTGILGEYPESTELFFAAFLNDLIDDNPDESSFAPGIFERSVLSVDDILYVAATERGSNTPSFLVDMRNYLATHPSYGPSELSEYWAAAAVNGLAVDDVPPLPPSVIGVPTHPVLGHPSPSNLPIMTFYGASDAESGLSSYHVSISAAPERPGPGGVTTPDSSIAWAEVLPEGDYYINVITIDRAGNESVGTTSHGPIVVGPPTPVDLVPSPPGLWEDYFLVRHDTSTTSSEGGVEEQLVGAQDFYMSLTYTNSSPSGGVPEGDLLDRIRVDGEFVSLTNRGSGTISANEEFQVLNDGPHNVVGGRHHVEILLDANGVAAESDETNNLVDRYVVFRPSIVAPGDCEIAPAAPRPYSAGFHTSQLYPNVAGHRVAPVNDFAAVLLPTTSNDVNYTLRLHDISTSYDNGFEAPHAISRTWDGQIETIVVNASVLGAGSFDVGAERVSGGGTASYGICHVSSQLVVPGDDLVLDWTDGDVLSLLEFTFNVIETGPFTVHVDAEFFPTDTYQELQLYWIDRLTGTLVPAYTTPDAVTDETGHATLELQVPTSGTYCLAIRRDVRPWGYAGPVTIAVNTTTVPLPDFRFIVENASWELPFIPSFDPQEGPNLTVPNVLIGNIVNTYPNLWLLNTGQIDGESVEFDISLDGELGEQLYTNEIAIVSAQSGAQFYGGDPIYVPAGRHTLTARIDPFDTIPEQNEVNNILAMQFGWEGPSLVTGASLFMGPPPQADGGLADLEIFNHPDAGIGDDASAEAINFEGLNSDGFRLEAPVMRGAAPTVGGSAARMGGGAWACVAVMPGAASDVDVRLHEVMDPARAFTMPVVGSHWDVGESDFVLIDRGATPPRPFDVSVVNVEGTEPYTIVSVESESIFPSSGVAYGPYGINAGEILRVHEVELDPGSYEVEILVSASDLGLSVFSPTSALGSPFRSKDDGRDRVPTSYSAPPGGGETVAFDVGYGEEGVYCVVVWKATASDLPVDEDYLLTFTYDLAELECVAVDGFAGVGTYGDAVSVQTTQTDFGDAMLGQYDAADGSELDAAYATVCQNVFYLVLAGNLESNFNDLELFLDTGPGGQNRLRGDNHSFGGGPDLNRMGDDGSGNGLQFDDAFSPNWWFSVQGGNFIAPGGGTIDYKLTAYQAELLSGGGGTGHYLGATVAGSNGILEGAGADNPGGIRVTIDNRNTAGVTAGTGASSGGTVQTGVEFAIPLEAIGNPGCIKVSAMVNGRNHDLLSNQVLPPLSPGTGNLVEPRTTDFRDHAGDQFFTYCAPGVDVENTGPGAAIAVTRLHRAVPNPFNPRTRVAFTLEAAKPVDLEVFDLVGRRVRTLALGESVPAGRHEAIWDGLDDGGRPVASGTYLVRLRAGDHTEAQRVTLIK